MPLPGLMMVVVSPEPPLEPEPLEPEPLDPLEPEPPDPLEPEPPLEPDEPAPLLTVVVGTLATGVGVVTVGVLTVVPPPPEPLLPVPVPLPPEPVLVGVVVCVGREPATGCEIVAEVERCPALLRGVVAVPWPTCARRVLRLLANTEEIAPVCAPCELTALTEASGREEEEECDPDLGCAVSVCVAGEPMPPSLGHPL